MPLAAVFLHVVIKVLIGVRTQGNSKAAESKLKDENFDAEFILLDVDDRKTHESAARHIEKNYGRLDALISNAGIYIVENENGARTLRQAKLRRKFSAKLSIRIPSIRLPFCYVR